MTTSIANVQQIPLWQEQESSPRFHHHIETSYSSGHRETYCTAQAYRPDRPGDWQWSAGFVASMVTDECAICHPKKSESAR